MLKSAYLQIDQRRSCTWGSTGISRVTGLLRRNSAKISIQTVPDTILGHSTFGRGKDIRHVHRTEHGGAVLVSVRPPVSVKAADPSVLDAGYGCPLGFYLSLLKYSGPPRGSEILNLYRLQLFSSSLCILFPPKESNIIILKEM